MKILLLILTLGGIGLAWAVTRSATTDLRTQIAAARHEHAEMAALQRERERLQQLRRDAATNAQRERIVAERARAEAANVARAQPVRRPPPPALTVGEWLPLAAWKNRGNASPTAAVETALWAAAGGDTAALGATLLLDETVRGQAAALLARLPEPARGTYPSPEHLLAAFTTKSIPLGDAQLVWQHQAGPDAAVVCVFVKNTDASTVPATATPLPEVSPESREQALQRARRRAAEKNPPTAPANPQTIATYLSLRRSDDGWKLVVPPSAIEKIAKELGGAQ